MKTAIFTAFLTVAGLFSGCTALGAAENPSSADAVLPENTIRVQPALIGMLDVYQLENSLQEEDIFLVNVHIPFEGNIADTDLFVPYNEIAGNLTLFPDGRDQKIVVYCKVGAMGMEAAQTLLDLGYTNVWNLTGGYEAWKEAGFAFLEKE